MSRPPSIWSRVNRVRRVTAMSVLLCYVLGQGIVPIPVISAARTDDTPYPCQNHACGCSSAAQCWKKCCCFSKEQKIAWAKANNVAVPYHLVGESPPLAETSKDHEHQGGCCSKKSSGGCCSKGHVARPCCSRKHSTASNSARDDQPRTVAISDLLACRGVRMLWVLTPPTLPAGVDEIGLSLSRTFEVRRSSDDLLLSATRMPPIPPPRLG